MQRSSEAYIVPNDDVLEVVELVRSVGHLLLLLTSGNDSVEEHDECAEAEQDHERLDFVPERLQERDPPCRDFGIVRMLYSSNLEVLEPLFDHDANLFLRVVSDVHEDEQFGDEHDVHEGVDVLVESHYVKGEVRPGRCNEALIHSHSTERRSNGKCGVRLFTSSLDKLDDNLRNAEQINIRVEDDKLDEHCSSVLVNPTTTKHNITRRDIRSTPPPHLLAISVSMAA